MTVFLHFELDADKAVAHGIHRDVGRDPAAGGVLFGGAGRSAHGVEIFDRGGGVGGASDGDRAVADVAREFVGAVGGVLFVRFVSHRDRILIQVVYISFVQPESFPLPPFHRKGRTFDAEWPLPPVGIIIILRFR